MGGNFATTSTIMDRKKCNGETISFRKETTTLFPSKQKRLEFIVNKLYIYVYIDPVLFYATLTEI